MYHRLLPIQCVILLLFLLFTCKRVPDLPYQAQKTALGDSAMVVTPHPLATEVGLQVLREGGNAVDATVAVHLALAVVYPRAGNLGGGGFMVLRTNTGEVAALDYREKAPMEASRDMYLDSLGQVVEGLSRHGHLAAGVPGTVAGLKTAHERFGKLPFSRLIEPAIRLAEEGYAISASEADRLNSYQFEFAKYSTTDHAFLKPGWSVADRLVQPDLAYTLQRIREQGRAGFYEGKTADLIVAEMERGGGLITHEDLRNYQAKWREPVIGYYEDYRIISMPPPSSGGIALVQLLKMVAPYRLSDLGFHSADAVHLMAEAERRVYADRARHLGDSDFYEVPRDSLLNEDYLAARMSSYDPEQASRSDSILAGRFQVGIESFETTHTSIVDPAGNAVSVTTTLNSNFGCKVVVGGAGFFLNNEMDDFSAKPGVPNQFGLIGAEANAIQPQKRMLSSMTPTIIEQDGELFMVLGSPGGSTIITAVFQVFLNVAEFGMDLDEAVRAGRFHHQWLPEQILLEEGTLDSMTRQTLKEMGHSLKEIRRMAVVKAIHILPDGRRQGVGDPRNPDDDARGF